MKKYIIIAFLVLFGFTSCNDYLDVSSDSKHEKEYVFGQIEEMDRMLTAVYASMLSNNTYGSIHLSNFALNSDVEFTSFTGTEPNVNGSEIKRFDGASNNSDVSKYWTSMYKGIESANIFIEGTLNGSIYDDENEEIQQMLGEAKTLRAMFYHDLVVHFGDVPFTTTPTSLAGDSPVAEVKDRNEILTFCIEELRAAAPKMKYARVLNEGVKRVSKEFTQGLIARMALTRGGYSLYPDKSNASNVGTMERPSDYLQYYEIARDYADSVITSQTHSLTKSFRDVFIDECNYISTANDDPIFEIPFLRYQSGDVGYIHGPSGDWTNNTTTDLNVWGRAAPSSRLNAFYRFSFDREDARLDYTIGMWYYQTNGTPRMRADYYVHNNKWSKFWTDRSNLNLTLSPGSEGKTGIAYPYMRYAEILLIYAEAVNELENGVGGANGAKAKDALRQVRERAFRGNENSAEKVDAYVESVSASKETFFEAIYNERKWEFGGENLRWKDLVRWNLYTKVIVESFMDYHMAAYLSDGITTDEPPFNSEKWEKLPPSIYYKEIDNPEDKNIYPNTTLKIMELYNPYELVTNPGSSWTAQDYYKWTNSDTGMPSDQALYSFRGYIRDGLGTNYMQMISLYPDNLPPVRYILPYPQDAINRSSGKYKNYYGY